MKELVIRPKKLTTTVSPPTTSQQQTPRPQQLINIRTVALRGTTSVDTTAGQQRPTINNNSRSLRTLHNTTTTWQEPSLAEVTPVHVKDSLCLRCYVSGTSSLLHTCPRTCPRLSRVSVTGTGARRSNGVPSTCPPTVSYLHTTLGTSANWWTNTLPRLLVNQVIEVHRLILRGRRFKYNNVIISDHVPLSARNLPPSFWDCNWVGSPSSDLSSAQYGGDHAHWPSPASSDPWHNYMAAQMAVTGGSYSAHHMYHNARWVRSNHILLKCFCWTWFCVSEAIHPCYFTPEESGLNKTILRLHILPWLVSLVLYP